MKDPVLLIMLGLWVAIGSTLAMCAPAFAEPTCGPRAELMPWLADQQGEGIAAIGMMASGDLLVTTADPDDGSWSTVVIRPDDTACLVTHGDVWQAYDPLSDPNIIEEY